MVCFKSKHYKFRKKKEILLVNDTCFINVSYIFIKILTMN